MPTLAALVPQGIEASRSGVSRRLADMERELGIADLVEVTNATVHNREPTIERILNLSANIKKWLEDEGAAVPDEPLPRRKKSRD